MDHALRRRREATVMEHKTAENANEFERCIGAFAPPRHEIVATGETFDGPDGVHQLLLQNHTAFPDFHFHPEIVHPAEQALIVVIAFEGDGMVCEGGPA